jgi:hypothetical protein
MVMMQLQLLLQRRQLAAAAAAAAAARGGGGGERKHRVSNLMKCSMPPSCSHGNCRSLYRFPVVPNRSCAVRKFGLRLPAPSPLNDSALIFSRKTSLANVPPMSTPKTPSTGGRTGDFGELLETELDPRCRHSAEVRRSSLSAASLATSSSSAAAAAAAKSSPELGVVAGGLLAASVRSLGSVCNDSVRQDSPRLQTTPPMICDGDVSTGSGGERAQTTIARDSAARHGSARAAKASWEQRTTVDRESGSIALRVPRRQLWPARLARVCAQAGGQGAGRVDGATTHEAANLTFSCTAVSFVGKP